MKRLFAFAVALLLVPQAGLFGQEEKKEETTADLPAGHSGHGEAFNEGPRQKAYLMDGLGKVDFPVSTKHSEAQKFITQGVAQLHGFWYFESERSFRQAATLDPECAMAYWGMAMSNLGNEKRAKGFIEQAVKRKEAVTPREAKYIDALNDWIQAGSKKKKERAENYARALERILYDHPDDVEAKALLALQLWKNRGAGIKISSYLAVDGLLSQVFEAEPMHPAHHFRIHLWDTERPQRGLASAAVCGQASPAIAHMWHMPGHIYSRLKRYHDAVWQQEASARTDHAHMMRDRVLPDQIHNFAHNNEWLIRNLNYIGRVNDAIDLARNMTELPRHPKYNVLTKRGSYSYGRSRLTETLRRYELWEDMIAMGNSPYLEKAGSETHQVTWLRRMGEACFRSGQADRGHEHLADLQSRLEQVTKQRDEAVAKAEEKATKEKKDKKAVEKAKSDAKRPFGSRVSALEKAIAELEGHRAAADEDFAAALPLLKKAGGVDTMHLAYVQFRAGETDKAIEAATKYADSHRNEVQPQAMLVRLLYEADKKDEARKRFELLRDQSSAIDLEVSPVFTRLAPIAKAFELPADWRKPRADPQDVGDRPNLDTLGPFRWSPSPAPDWTLNDAEGKPRSLKQFQGKPVVVIFYLGYACLHCAEQLQAFSPMAKEFEQEGISLIAISTDDRDGLKMSIKNYEGEFAIPLVSDSKLDVFERYRAHDDFENQPLHGTFLIDKDGLVRWQDISHEPFMDPKFVLSEARRLLSQ